MKILHILSSNFYSGAENVACYIIESLSSDGVDFFYTSNDGSIREVLSKRGIKFLPHKPRNLFSLAKVIKNVKPDIVHAHDFSSCILTSFIRCKAKKIFHIHKKDPDAKKMSLKSFLFYKASKKANHIFWVSQEAYDEYHFKNKISNKSSVLVNVVNSKEIIKKSLQTTKYKDSPDVLFIGRLVEQKNPLRLLKIVELIVREMPEFKLGVVGQGELLSEMKKNVDNNSLTTNVVFYGALSNPFPILKNAKCVIFTSIFEGTPMVALESMCLGVPIISTPVDGMKNIIDHDYNGYLFENDDQFSDKIIEICKKPNLLIRLKKNAFLKFDKINDEEKYISSIMKIYFSQEKEIKK